MMNKYFIGLVLLSGGSRRIVYEHMECVPYEQRAYTAFRRSRAAALAIFQSAGFCNAEGSLEFAKALIGTSLLIGTSSRVSKNGGRRPAEG
jgi:hypothetical protein